MADLIKVPYTELLQRATAIRQEAESRKVALSTIGGFVIKKQVGENNAIFGTVTDREIAQMITAKTTYNVMSPGALPGQLSLQPAVVGGDAGVFRLGIVTCPPGRTVTARATARRAQAEAPCG